MRGMQQETYRIKQLRALNEISKRIKEEYENGKEYYNYHGKDPMIIPSRTIDKPSKQFIQFHNQHIFKG